MGLRKILYVDNRTKYVCSHRIPWLRGAEQAGFDVHVTTLTAGDPSGIRDAGFTYHSISGQGRSNNPLHEARFIVTAVPTLQGYQTRSRSPHYPAIYMKDSTVRFSANRRSPKA